MSYGAYRYSGRAETDHLSHVGFVLTRAQMQGLALSAQSLDRRRSLLKIHSESPIGDMSSISDSALL